MYDSFSVSGFCRRRALCKMVAAKEILSFGEEESRNLDEYLDDSEAGNEKMSKEKKSKKSSLRKR